MHISSLPSPYGIGTLGKAAYDFADFLHKAGQRYWQILPIGPTSYGDSPYQSFSTCAGNPYFIDLDLLVEDGLLTREEIDAINWGADTGRVDYGFQYSVRFDLLYHAYVRGRDRDEDAIREFRDANPWVEEYALYMALKRSNGMQSWEHWPEEIRLRRPGAADTYATVLAEDTNFFIYLQFLFYRQWNRLRDYVHGLGIRIIGDLPIYVPYDSCDVWANPHLFQLDEGGLPTGVAGVPPDYFSEDGQLWGNPLYNWDRMREDGYAWWMQRIAAAGKLFDVIRIDHFRGLESYWAVPYGDKNARRGQWVKGPGTDFIDAVHRTFPELHLIAEDLGFLTPEVIALQKASGYPGMKVLEFAFDSRDTSSYLPHSYGENCICYTGTHDNAPLALWRTEADKADIAFAKKYLGLNDEEGFNAGIIRGGMSCQSRLFVAQMQDYLGLGKGCRMNTPGTSSGNWQWRMLSGEASKKLAKSIHETTRIYGRL